MTIRNIPREDAVALIRDNLNFTPQEETIPLGRACGRVAARDIAAKLNLPGDRCSRWDGICFAYDRYLACGKDVGGWLPDRDYIFCNTGIALFRDEFDTMVKIEDTQFEDGTLLAIRQPEVQKGQNVAPAGERIAAGDVIVARDTKLSPSHLNLLAGGGVSCVPVYRKPKVALIPTGNELVSLHDTPRPGQTIESNTFSMAAKVEKWGGEAILYPILPDDPAALQRQLLEAVEAADLVVISGGSGRGQHDVLQQSLAAIGTLHFSDVEHGPGKRTCFCVIEGKPVVGLVGPPGGEEMTFDFYVLPALLSCLGQRVRPTVMAAVLDEDIPPHVRVNFYYSLWMYWDEAGQCYRARVLPHSGIDRSIDSHNAYLFVEKAGPGHARGETVTLEIRRGYEDSY